MADRMDQYFSALAAQAGAPSPEAEEIDAVLDLARVVAHQEERRFAPVAAYLAGLAAGDKDGPAGRADAVRALLRAARELSDASPADQAGFPPS